MSGEQRCGYRATRPVSGTDERDPQQGVLRAPSRKATTEEDPEKQESSTDDYDPQQGETGEGQRRALASDAGRLRLRTGRSQGSLTLRRLRDMPGRVLVLRCRAARARLARERAGDRRRTDDDSQSDQTQAAPCLHLLTRANA